MKQWEYKIMRLDELSTWFDQLDETHGGSMYDKEGKPIEFLMEKSGYNSLGILGWELIQIKEDKHGEIYYFKREKK
jgi:hypothetical protein